MKERKKFWLLPINLVLVLLGSLIVLTQGSARGAVYLHAVLEMAVRDRWQLPSHL